MAKEQRESSWHGEEEVYVLCGACFEKIADLVS